MNVISKLSIPFAIIIAGGLIAYALYASGAKSAATAAGPDVVGHSAITIRPTQDTDHLRGSKDAAVTLVEYTDPECPFCKQFHATMQQVMDKYQQGGQVAWVYRHFPIPQLHPKAPKEAEALECAGAQGGESVFWKFTDAVYETTHSNNSLDDGMYNTPATPPTGPDGRPYYTQKEPRYKTDAGQLSTIALNLGLDKTLFESCLAGSTFAARVSKDTDEAQSSGGQGTPYNIFVSKSVISSDTTKLIDSLGAQFPGTFSVSDDKHRIAMSGALPFSVVDQILTTMTK